MTDATNGAAPDQPAEPAPASEAAAAPDPAAALEAEKAELKDRLLRSLADLENLRKRSEKDVADARVYAVTRFARDLLDVVDNMRRALDSVPADAAAAADGPFKALIEGVQLTERDFLKKLAAHGVRKLEPVGEKFDPNFHQAMFEVPDETRPSGTVTQVVQPGYALNDRVLRPAMVGISKGGPKPAAAPEGVDKVA
jgi:molecular chaperone GrpE